ncbi:MAG: DUF1275 domain-containing protein [Methylobacteriaceae bacterium]|nr:DUF1275 domain-containing protein [Methylobacteriaceae bacterium]
MEDRTRFCLGLLLTAIAGWVDAIGFISLGGFYLSFMSGNTTQLGIGLTHFDMGLVRLPALLLACFVVGAFAGTLIYARSARWHLPAILLFEALLLAGALMLWFVKSPVLGAAEPLAIAMGAQNAALRSDRGHRIGGTFVTGTVFGIGEKLALWCLGREDGRPALRHALGWSALAFGAAMGAAAYAAAGLPALIAPAGCLLILAAVTAFVSLRAPGRGPALEERRHKSG